MAEVICPLLALTLAQSTASAIPRLGIEEGGGRVTVWEGGNVRPAMPGERRRMAFPPEPPPHPSCLYRLLPAEMPGDFGTVTGHKVIGRDGKVAASLKELLGDFSEIANVRAQVVGWGPGPHEAVVERSGGSPSAGASAQFVRLDLRTRRALPRVEMAAGNGLGLVIGSGAKPEARWSRTGASLPALFQLASGNPVRLRLRGRPISGVPSAVPETGRWALVRDAEGNLLVDLRAGFSRRLPAGEARFLP